jgi:hypothetical protein
MKNGKKANSSIPTPKPDEDAKALELIGAWQGRQEEWETWAAAQPYDGVLGTLPDWMGPEIQGEFLRVRGNLIGSDYAGVKMTPALALSLMEHFRRLGEEGVTGANSSSQLMHHWHDIEQLSHWRWRHSQGQALGQAQIVGLALVSAAALANKHRSAQLKKARLPRNAAFEEIFGRLLGAQYDDWTNKELWDELISFSDERGVTIEETHDPLSLTWSVDNSDREGKLRFSSFPAKLANLRAKSRR